MSVVLHLSDTHFGTEQAPVVEALVALTRQQQPDLVVLSGDVTQRARPAQFEAAQAFMGRLRAPALVIPGNHDLPLFDLWARWRHPYAHYIAAFGANLEPVHASPDLLVVCVNTTRAARHKNGEVSAAQIEHVAHTLAGASAAQLRVVVVHQPVAVTRPEDVPNLLRGHAAALQRWSAAGADLVLGGHIHLPYVTAIPGLARPVWAVQAGTAVSSRVRTGAPNSVNLLRWEAGSGQARCRMERWCFCSTVSAFVRTDVSDIQPARCGAPAASHRRPTNSHS